jgi:hypothetical protein
MSDVMPDSIPDSIPDSMPSSSAPFAKSPIARIALVVVQLTGLALLAYWGWHVYTNLPYWDDYRREALLDANPLLTPAYRVSIDVLALVAACLMLKKSKWALVPYALHFVAYLCFVLSITGYTSDMRMLPRIALLIGASQILVLALLLWLEAIKVLGNWPLHTKVHRGASVKGR